MASPLDHVEYLARSENRLRILEAVANDSLTRPEIAEATAVPRATLGRILSDLTEKGWIEQDQTRYRSSPEGAYLAWEFRSLLETVETLTELGDLIQWFPTNAVDFSLGRLNDARITKPTQSDSIAPVRRATEILTESNEIQGLTSVFAPDALRANHEAVVEQGQQFKVVFTKEVVELAQSEPDLEVLFRELMNAETATVYRYEGSLPTPYNIWLYNGAAAIGVSDDTGAPRAIIETDDPAVREWVESTIDAHRQDAMELSPADL